MLKQVSAFILTALLVGLPHFSAAAIPEAGGWAVACTGAAPARNCLITTRRSFPNNLGGNDALTVALRVDAQCRSLHVNFDTPIALSRPVALAVDGGQRVAFYTNPELSGLARSIDDRVVPAGAPMEFVRFFREVESGALDRTTTPGQELVARFAHIKEPWRLGMACVPTERLMAELRGGRMMVVDFWTQPRADTVELYHWPQLAARSVSISLQGLAEALDKAEEGASSLSN